MQTVFDRSPKSELDVTNATWTDLLSLCVRTAAQLNRLFAVDVRQLAPVAEQFPMRINPYYLSLIRKKKDPIWIQSVPDPSELNGLKESVDL